MVGSMLARQLSRWHIALETSLAVVVVVLLKLLAEYFNLEFITLNPLFTSIIGGGIFLFGLILAGTLADYKEGERLPADIVSACESIYVEGCYTKKTKPNFDLDALTAALREVISGLRADVSNVDSRQALRGLSALSHSFLEMEQLGVPPNYIARLKSEEATVRRALLRMYHIQSTEFLPSAYVLVQSIIALVLVLLVLTRIEPFWDSVIVTVFVTYIFVYVYRLLRFMDRPFRVDADAVDEVSLFLLSEFEERLSSP
jgi:hypothetical protein